MTEIVDQPRRKAGNPKWTKGVSGNPGGRPKSEAEFRAKVQECGQELFDFLIGTVRSEKADMGCRIRAADLLLNRGYGKPVESIKIAGGVTVEHRKRVILETRGESQN